MFPSDGSPPHKQAAKPDDLEYTDGPDFRSIAGTGPCPRAGRNGRGGHVGIGGREQVPSVDPQLPHQISGDGEPLLGGLPGQQHHLELEEVNNKKLANLRRVLEVGLRMAATC